MLRPLAAFCALALVTIAAGCGGSSGAVATAPGRAAQVPLKVMHAPNGAVLALVPVFIRGHGPYRFAVDTGASESVVDRRLVRRLHLKVLGVTKPISGVVATTRALKVAVVHWRAGNVPLQPDRVISVEMPQAKRGGGLLGLLGSDVLSRFGSVKIDYGLSRLVLEPRR